MLISALGLLKPSDHPVEFFEKPGLFPVQRLQSLFARGRQIQSYVRQLVIQVEDRPHRPLLPRPMAEALLPVP